MATFGVGSGAGAQAVRASAAPSTAAAPNKICPLRFMAPVSHGPLKAADTGSVLDRVSPELAESAAPKIASIRRAVKKHAVALANPVPQPSPDADLPTSLSKVAGWLKEHPEADPRVFAPHAKQKAAATRNA